MIDSITHNNYIFDQASRNSFDHNKYFELDQMCMLIVIETTADLCQHGNTTIITKLTIQFHIIHIIN